MRYLYFLIDLAAFRKKHFGSFLQFDFERRCLCNLCGERLPACLLRRLGAGSELVVLVFEQDVERGVRSVTARDILLQVDLVRFAQFVARVHLLFENAQIIPNHDDFLEKCFEPATVAAATRTGKLSFDSSELSAGCITSVLRLKPGFNGRNNHLLFEQRPQILKHGVFFLTARHQRQRAPGTGPMLVPSLQRYQAYPLSKPGIESARIFTGRRRLSAEG